jgi:Patatin-like phospholipase
MRAVRTFREPTISDQLRALSFAVARCRFNVLVLVGGAVLLLTDQGRDLLIAYGEDGKTLRLTAGAFVWAFSIWGWARVLLDIQWAELPTCLPCYNFWRRWLPRILGVIAFAVVAFSAWQAGQTELAWWALGGLVVFFVFVWKRRRWARHLAQTAAARGMTSLAGVARLFEANEIDPASLPPHPDLWAALQLPAKGARVADAIALRWLIFMAMVATWVLLFALGTFAPVVLGTGTGAMILLFVWGATWLPLGSMLSYYADRLGFPLLTGLALLALASSFVNDNHEIRHAPSPRDVATRPTVSEALAAWAKANRAAEGAPVPFVVVATAGGGIRAAYWTATVLGALQDEAPELPRRLFAISGVSGGSVGAAMYRALVTLPAADRARACSDAKMPMLKCAQRVLGEDFLGPVSAALLYPDLVQRFVPYPLLPDRGAALEKAFEAGFRKTTGVDLLQSSLASLSVSQGARPWPALFLNATWVGNGRRIVASNLRYGPGPEGKFFELANDQLAILGRDVRLSTAAHNSARFPAVSPPGTWKHDGKIAGRLQDGGLFENYGAETAQEILEFACATVHCAPASGTQGVSATLSPVTRRLNDSVTVFPVVVLISSDPTLPAELAESPDNPPIRFAYEMRATVRSYERVRSGRGQEAATHLQEWALQHGGKFFHFRMCDPHTKAVQPPLGWALSQAAKETIASYLLGATAPGQTSPSCYTWNSGSLEALKELLASRS